jgi:enoyl-CoA hydratase
MEFNIMKPQRFGKVEVLTISRPASLNALNSEFFREINIYLDDLLLNEEVSVLIITGEGKAFVAGADISEMIDLTPAQAKGFSEKGQQTFYRIENSPIPVIAAVNGYALGGGCELAAACDFRIASTKAVFGLPEVSLGLIPGYAGTQRLPRLIGLGNAMKCILTGGHISAQEAYRMGLVQALSEPEQLIDDVLKIASKIASQGPKAVRKAKKVIRQGRRLGFEAAMDLEKDSFSDLFNDEGYEGMRAFLEKRKPKWSSEG